MLKEFRMETNRSNQQAKKSCPERTPLARRPLLDERQVSELESLFKVLGNSTRLRLVHAMVKAGEMCVGDLAQQIGTQTQAVSNQLKHLALHGVVVSRREGNNIYYSVIDNCVITMIERGLCLIACAADRSAKER